MVAHNPLHRSGRAGFPHPALALGDDAKSPERVRVTDAGRGQPAFDEPPHPVPEHAAVLTIAPQVTAERRITPARRGQAATQAREILETFGSDIPVDVEGLAGRLGYPVSWRSLPRTTRGAVAGDAGHPVLVLNRNYPFHADVERRWAVAEPGAWISGAR